MQVRAQGKDKAAQILQTRRDVKQQRRVLAQGVVFDMLQFERAKAVQQAEKAATLFAFSMGIAHRGAAEAAELAARAERERRVMLELAQADSVRRQARTYALGGTVWPRFL